MIPYFVTDTLGRVLRTGQCEEHMLAAQAGPGETAHEGEASDALHFLDGDVLLDRPSMALPPLTAAPEEDWTVPDAPPGTVIMIDREVVGEADENGVTLVFPETGQWRIDLEPPFPWCPLSVEVTVA